MRRANVGGSLIGIAAYVFVGASTDCVSDLPPVTPSAGGSASSSPGGEVRHTVR